MGSSVCRSSTRCEKPSSKCGSWIDCEKWTCTASRSKSSQCELGLNPLHFVIATASPTTCPKSASMTASNLGQVVRQHIHSPGAGSLKQQGHFQESGAAIDRISRTEDFSREGPPLGVA